MKNDTREITGKFFGDKYVIILLISCAAMTLATFGVVFARLRSNAFKVPVQYIVDDGSVISTSQWYTLYSLVLFALFTVVVSILLSHRLYPSNPLFSRGVLLLQLLVSIVAFITTYALLGLVSQI